ncbi:Acg family FMN-binding oxidoreductase [Algirhabdus cladophorae]|uniref:Acg family FMN-binding oxidoreductase n=1 Tax=Algirhabdus cladophorae TaxID=3377108 RepID=UPI003B84A5A8
MTLSRRKTLALLGGGFILAAGTATGLRVSRKPGTALEPWQQAGGYEDSRMNALSYAILAPNPHNRQPWLVDLATSDQITLLVDTNRMLPHTDPFNRQITIGLGCFLEVLRMAASHQGQRAEITTFPDGYDDAALDQRPVAVIKMIADPTIIPDPLFDHVLDRRTEKEPYDLTRRVAQSSLDILIQAGRSTTLSGSVDPADIAAMRAICEEALVIEIETPRTYKESVDLFRIGAKEVNANPDGIDFTGPLFEAMGATGLFSRTSALDSSTASFKAGMEAVLDNTRTAMGFVWQVTPTNTRLDQLAAGADWVRLHLAATGAGVAVQPLSQALQEYPEMTRLYDDVHKKLAPTGGTVQMLARLGYTAPVPPSPRWPIDAKIVNA